MKQVGPEWIKAFLSKKGRETTIEEAELIFNFLKKLTQKESMEILTVRYTQ